MVAIFKSMIYRTLTELLWILISAFLTLSAGKSLAQSTCFAYSYGQPGADVCFSVRQLPDSSLYLFGYTENGQVGGYDFCLKKVMSDGTLCWSKDFGTTGLDFGLFMNRADDYNLILIGTTQNPVTIFGDDVLLIKVDSSGQEIWRQVIGGHGNEICRYVEQTADAGYIFCGLAPDTGNSNDAWVVKTDAFGNVEWTNFFGVTGNDVAARVVATSSDSWAMSCDTWNAGNGTYDVLLIGLDSAGNQTFSHLHSDSLTNGCQGMMFTRSGRIVTFGESETFPGSPFDYLVHVYDNLGNPVRDLVFGGPGAEAMFDMTEAGNGDYVGTGYTNSSGSGLAPIDLSVVRMDTLGNVLWSRQFGSGSIDLGYSIIPALGGGFFVAGRTTLADEEFYLLHIDENGLLSTLPGPFDWHDNVVLLYPSPASSRLTARLAAGNTAWEIVDVGGRCVMLGQTHGLLSIDLDISELNAGCYFFKSIGPSGKSQYSRFVIHR